MKSLSFLLKIKNNNPLFLIPLLFLLLITSSCYKDDDDSGLLRQLSMDNIEKLVTRNHSIYKLSDSILIAYSNLQSQYPYKDSGFTLFLNGKRNLSTKVMDSIVHLLDSVNSNALHRYTLNKEAYDYAKRTSYVPKGYVVDSKYTLEYLDTLYLNLNKMMSSYLPNIKKQATDFSDATYRRLSLWYLKLEQYLVKAKTLNTQFTENITPNKYTTKLPFIFPSSDLNKKTVYEFLLPFQKDSVEKVSRIENDMLVVDFYLRNKSFPLGIDTSSILPINKIEKKLIIQADTFMFVIKYCPTFLQIEEYLSKSDTISKDLAELEKLIKNNFPTMLIGGKNAVVEIGRAISGITKEKGIVSGIKTSLITKIASANNANFLKSGGIATVQSLPNDYAEQKLKVLSDLKSQVEKQVEIEIAKSKEWIKERVSLLSKLINKEEQLRDKIILDNYTSNRGWSIGTQTLSFTTLKTNIVNALKQAIDNYKKIKSGIDSYIDYGTFSNGMTLDKIPTLTDIEKFKNIYKGIDLSMQMAYLIDSCTNAWEVVVYQNISKLPTTGFETKKAELELLATTLNSYVNNLRSGIGHYYHGSDFVYTEPHFVLSQFKAIRESIDKSNAPENVIFIYTPPTGNPRSFTAITNKLADGSQEVTVVNTANSATTNDNFVSVPIAVLPNVNIRTSNGVANALNQLTNIQVEIDEENNTLASNQFAMYINISCTNGTLVQIPLFPSTKNSDIGDDSDNIYTLSSLTDIDNTYFGTSGHRDYPNVQNNSSYLAYGGKDPIGVLPTVPAHLNGNPSLHIDVIKISIYHWNGSVQPVQSIKIRGIFN